MWAPLFIHHTYHTYASGAFASFYVCVGPFEELCLCYEFKSIAPRKFNRKFMHNSSTSVQCVECRATSKCTIHRIALIPMAHVVCTTHIHHTQWQASHNAQQLKIHWHTVTHGSCDNTHPFTPLTNNRAPKWHKLRNISAPHPHPHAHVNSHQAKNMKCKRIKFDDLRNFS